MPTKTRKGTIKKHASNLVPYTFHLRKEDLQFMRTIKKKTFVPVATQARKYIEAGLAEYKRRWRDG